MWKFLLISLGIAPQVFAMVEYAQVKRFEEIPLREVSIIVTKEGYYPKHISIFEGEKIRFYVTTTESDKSCLTLPEKEVFVSANPGSISEAEAVFEQPGEYEFYCPVGKIRGRVNVLKKANIKREIASKVNKKVNTVWRPRDY